MENQTFNPNNWTWREFMREYDRRYPNPMTDEDLFAFAEEKFGKDAADQMRSDWNNPIPELVEAHLEAVATQMQEAFEKRRREV